MTNLNAIAPSNGVGTNVTIYSPGSAGGSALTVSAHGLSNATNYVVNVTNDTGASIFNISSNGNINLGSQTVSATSLELNFSWPTLLAGEARTFNNSNDFLTISASNSAAIKDSGINIFGPVWSNGFASLATGGNTITVNATGLTNTETTNLLRVIGFQGTSVVLTNLTTHSSIGPYTYSSPAVMVLQPNEALIGTGCSGSCTNL